MPPQRHRDNRRKSTTSLPSALRDELGIPSPTGVASGVRQAHSVLGRKDARKAERQEEKGLRVIGRGTSATQGERGKQMAEQKAEERRLERERAKEAGMRAAQERQRAAREAAAAQESSRNSADKVTERKRKHNDEELTKAKKDKKKKIKDKESTSASSTSRPSPYEPATAETSTSASRQRQGVSSSHETPLQRLLARQQGGSSSSSSNAAKGKGRAKPVLQEETDEERRKRRMRMTQAERDEEDEIAWLESKLGRGAGGSKDKTKKKKKKGGEEDEDLDDLEDDGLDDLLEDLDRFYPGMYDEDGEAVDSEGDLDEAFDEEEEEEGSSDEEGEDDEDEDSELEDEDDEDLELDSSDEEVSDEDDQEEGDKDLSASSSKPASVAAPSTGKYMPPAARAAAAAKAGATSEVDSVEQQKLRRQAKGLLNRLGDGNIESILNEIEALYRVHKRADVTSCITRLILDMTSARSNLIDTLVILYATLTGALHHVVGIEFGAYFVQTLVDDFFKHYNSLPVSGSTEGEEEVGRECLNLAALLAQLYNLQIVACPLVYDMIRLFLGQRGDGKEDRSKRAMEGLREVDVELLLRVVKACGSQLRHDDASSLKAIIALAKERAAGGGATEGKVAHSSSSGNGGGGSSRARFMLESLADLKNNRQKAVAASESSPAGQALTRMKKFLGGLGKKKTLRTHEPLRVTLRDLEDAETKGKWWLVGAAWAGKGTGEEDGSGVTSAAPLPGASSTSTSMAATPSVKGKDAKLLSLARAHGMNTDARRSVFITLLGSEDYIDAAQRLSTLKLKGTQQREVVRVLLHCIGSEKVYNPYYALVGAQLAAESPGTRVTMQYCLWDFFRGLGEKNVGGRSIIERDGDDDDDDDDDAFGNDQGVGGGMEDRRISNLARAFGWWFAKGSLGLEVLKPLDFPLLKPRSTGFVRLLLVHFLLSTQTSAPMATLVLSKAPEAKLAARGLGTGGLPITNDEDDEDEDDDDDERHPGRPSSSSSLAAPFKKDRSAIERPLVKASALNLSVAQGLLLFLERNLDSAQLRRIVGQGPKADATTQRILNWATRVASQTLKIAATKGIRSKAEADFFD